MALTINNGANLAFNFTDPSGNDSYDQIGITGSGTVNYGSAGVLDINTNGGALATGTYTLINNATGAVVSTNVAGWTVSAAPANNNASNKAGLGYSFSVPTSGPMANDLVLTVSSGLTWGGQNSANWTDSPTNWYLGDNTQDYIDGTAVSFNDIQYSSGPAVTATSVKIGASGSSAVSPSSVVFTNSVVPYTLTSEDSGGQGIYGATTSVTLSGSMPVTLLGPNTYGGTTTLSPGSILVIADNDSLGALDRPVGVQRRNAAIYAVRCGQHGYFQPPGHIPRRCDDRPQRQQCDLCQFHRRRRRRQPDGREQRRRFGHAYAQCLRQLQRRHEHPKRHAAVGCRQCPAHHQRHAYSRLRLEPTARST